MKKHIISIMLVLVILLSCSIMTAFAQTEYDNSITFYFHCPEDFMKDGKVTCELTPKGVLTCEKYYGESMGNGLYKFVVPDLSSYVWFVITNNVEPISEVDPKLSLTDTFVIADSSSIYAYDSDKLIDINNKIYTNFTSHWADFRYYYGFGDWMNIDEWSRYQGYLAYTSNENYNCSVIHTSDPESYWFKYEELYTFNNNILTFGAQNEKSSLEESYSVYGNYVLRNNESYAPSISGYNVYLDSSKEVVSLREAYDTNIDGIESVFTDYGLGELIGDVDNDKSITILDATVIQKNLAQLSDFADNDKIQGNCEDGSISISYISDFNRDMDRSILDATAIQMHLAKK